MPPLVIAGLVAGGIKATTGIIQATQANKQIKNLAKNPIDEYSISPELQNSYSRAEGMINQGFATEDAAFNQGVARQQTGAFQSAVDMSGGNLSSAIGSALKAQNIGVQNDWAVQKVGMKSNRIEQANQLAGQIQNQRNLMVESRRQRRQSLEQAYGQAKQQGIENFTDGLTSAVSVAGAGAKSGTPAVPQSTMNSLSFNSNDYNNPVNDPSTII